MIKFILGVVILLVALENHVWANPNYQNMSSFDYFMKRLFDDVNRKDCAKLDKKEYKECYDTQLYFARTAFKIEAVLSYAYTKDVFKRFETFSILHDYVDPSHIIKTDDVFSQYIYIENDKDINFLADCLKSNCGKWITFTNHTAQSWSKIFDQSLKYIMCNLNEKRRIQKTYPNHHWPNLFEDAQNGLVAACPPLNIPTETHEITNRLYNVGHHQDIVSQSMNGKTR